MSINWVPASAGVMAGMTLLSGDPPILFASSDSDAMNREPLSPVEISLLDFI